jgi:hypothetical protein
MKTRMRAGATIVLTAAIPQLTGCIVHTTWQVPLAQLGPDERSWLGDSASRITGVTTRSGVALAFDSLPAAREVNGTVQANVGGRPHAVPRAEIDKVWVARPGHRPVPVGTSDLATALRQAPFGEERIGGVTTQTGDVWQFDPGASVYVARDSLFAEVAGGEAPYRIALADVQNVWVVRGNPGQSLAGDVATTALVLALVAGVAVAVWAASGPHMF